LIEDFGKIPGLRLNDKKTSFLDRFQNDLQSKIFVQRKTLNGKKKHFQP